MVKATAETVKKGEEEKVKTSVEISGYGGDLVDEATALIEAITESIVTEDERLAKAFKIGVAIRLFSAIGSKGEESN